MVRRIYITGTMSSGKTEIAKRLARKFVGSIFMEPIHEITSKIFSNSNVSQSDIELSQTLFLSDIVNAHEYKLLNDTQVFDTSFYVNEFFTKYLSGGSLTPSYYRLLMSARDLCESEESYHVVILNSYDTMMSRIKHRGRDYETSENTKFDYKSYYDSFFNELERLKRISLDSGMIFVENDGVVSIDKVVDEIYSKIMEIENGQN